MSKQSLTVQRNKQIVSNNSKSYNDKHPENPVSLRPIHDVKKYCIKIDAKGRIVPDVRKLASLTILAMCDKPIILRDRFLIAKA